MLYKNEVIGHYWLSLSKTSIWHWWTICKSTTG